MRLTFVHELLGAFGGAETNILLSARELKARGHQISLAYLKTSGKGQENWTKVFDPAFQVANPQDFRKAIHDFEPQLVYLHSLPDLAILEEILTHSRAPVVRMVHDHQLYCMRGYKYNVFSRKVCTRKASTACIFPCLGFLQRNRNGWLPIRLASYRAKQREIELNRRCDWVLTYSDYCRQELIQNGFDEARISLFAPVPCPANPYTAPAMPERNLILFAGQIIRGKGVDVLLRSLKRVQSPFECVILGDGNYRPDCESLCRELGLERHVRFAGYVPPEQLQAYYRDASVFAVTSVWPEPFGMVGPEAMLHGLPVVAFEVGGIREWLEHEQTGYVVPWMDEAAFANRIDELLRDKSLARSMGRKGFARVHRLFEAKALVEKLEQLFMRLIQQSPITNNENTNVNLVHGIC